MASNLSQTLATLASTKLYEVSQKKNLYDATKKLYLDRAEAAGSNKQQRITEILRGLARVHDEKIEKDTDSDDNVDDEFNYLISGTPDNRNWRNMLHFLEQSEQDKSIPVEILDIWEKQALDRMKKGSTKLSHAQFFGKMIIEWTKEIQEKSSGQVKPARNDLVEQQNQWESYVFNSLETDQEQIKVYLDRLFQTESAKKPFKQLQKHLRNFGSNEQWQKDPFSTEMLRSIAKSLSRSSNLPPGKVSLLKEISDNREVLSECADVLNMRMTRLEDWDWGTEGVRVMTRRQLNGRYRMYMDEDVLDIIMLHYIGNNWGVELKEALTKFFNSDAWEKPHATLSRDEQQRREDFLGECYVKQRLHDLRTKRFRKSYFMSHLPSHHDDWSNGYNDDDTANSSNPVEIKQSLLHMVATETLIADRLHGDFAVIVSDFSWFGPSLPLNTIFAVLEYYGVPQKWLNIIGKFLKMKVQWKGEVRERERGIPIDHSLSDMIGEAVLSVLDFAVNRETGAYLYRMHDDFWFWGRKETCEKAWAAMNEFASTMGMAYNVEKTGSVVLSGPSAPADTGNLPPGDVKWGFLKLDRESKRFLIDLEKAEEHVTELHLQLTSCKSVLSWIRAWNSYFAGFFTRNFGKPVQCFGRDHVDMMIKAYNRIEQSLFKKLDSNHDNVTEHLMEMIKREYQPGYELPVGILYLPIENGGFGLKNPYISLFALRGGLIKSPLDKIEKAIEQDKANYEKMKRHYDSDRTPMTLGRFVEKLQDENTIEREEFFSFEEYYKYPEAYSDELRDVYEYLLESPIELEIGRVDLAGVKHWSSLSPYNKSVYAIYGPQVIETFESVQTVDNRSIPLGVIKLLQSSKIRWQE